MGGNGVMAWFNNQGIPSASMNVTPEMQQYFSGTDWRSQMQPMNAWGNTQSPSVDYSNYEDLIMNPEHMPNRLQNLERFADNRFEGGDENVPGMGKKAIDFIDQPVQFGMRANHPMKGFLDKNFNYKALNQGTVDATANWLNKNQGEGITATNAAQKKGNFFTNLMDNTLLGQIASMRNPLNEKSPNYNPALQGQIDYLRDMGGLGPTSEGYKIRGGPLEGLNLVSGFGTNDYDEMLANKKAWFEKRMADDKGYSETKYQQLLDEIARRQALETAAATGGPDTDKGGGWSAADVASSSKAFDHMKDYGPHTGGGGWSPAAGQMASGMGGGSQQAKSGSQKAGGSGRTDKGGGWAQGGRVGYSRGGRVGILSVF